MEIDDDFAAPEYVIDEWRYDSKIVTWEGREVVEKETSGTALEIFNEAIEEQNFSKMLCMGRANLSVEAKVRKKGENLEGSASIIYKDKLPNNSGEIEIEGGGNTDGDFEVKGKYRHEF